MPTTTRHVGRFRRTVWIVAAFAVALGVFVFLRLGTFLVKEDPLQPGQPADAIFVLAGSRMNRPLEAADLYQAGAAGKIVISSDERDEAATFIEAKGVHFPYGAELARDALIALGVPGSAILIPPRIHDNTAQEANTLRQLAHQYGWTRVIVVTSKYHTRRATFAMRRELNGAGVTIVMRASRYDSSDPERWWRHRGDIRIAASEVPKLAAYLLGLGE